MLGTAQFLIFEVGSECNLSKVHTQCPNSIREPSSSQTLTDELILQCIDEAYTKHNFTGLVGWHYHNEPMLEHERIFSLMEKYPKGRYVLWTNGLIQPDDDRINLFEQVYCTDYYPGSVNEEYYSGCEMFSIFPIKRFDDRIKDTKSLPKNNNRCVRPHIEFIIDNWGTAHMCCQDWRAEIEIGNLWKNSFRTLIKRKYKLMRQIRRRHLPDRCLQCSAKVYRLPKFDLGTCNKVANG